MPNLANTLPRFRRGGQVRCTSASIPDVEETYCVLISWPFWMRGAETGVNENSVAMGNEAVFTNVTKQKKGLLDMDLLRLGLERSRDADDYANTLTVFTLAPCSLSAANTFPDVSSGIIRQLSASLVPPALDRTPPS